MHLAVWNLLMNQGTQSVCSGLGNELGFDLKHWFSGKGNHTGTQSHCHPTASSIYSKAPSPPKSRTSAKILSPQIDICHIHSRLLGGEHF